MGLLLQAMVGLGWDIGVSMGPMISSATSWDDLRGWAFCGTASIVGQHGVGVAASVCLSSNRHTITAFAGVTFGPQGPGGALEVTRAWVHEERNANWFMRAFVFAPVKLWLRIAGACDRNVPLVNRKLRRAIGC